MGRMQKLIRQFALVFTITLALVVSASLWFSPSPLQAQFVRPDVTSQEVYSLLPNFPRENQYVRLETGQVDPNNTLLFRLISYHTVIKNRPVRYRLDWKLTLADYLGVNERIVPDTYPGNRTLQENPLEGDRAAINQLNRRERQALINALLQVFNPQALQPQPPLRPRPQSPPSDLPAPTSPRRPSLPPPGGADLLR